MAAKKTASESETRVINPDGSLAPRPGAGIDPLAPTGLPPKGAVSEPHSFWNGMRRDPDVARTVNADDLLPTPHVSRQRVGAHVRELNGKLTHIEREIQCTNVFGANGIPNTYQLDRLTQLQESAAQIRGEIADIATWSDSQCQRWAKEHGYR